MNQDLINAIDDWLNRWGEDRTSKKYGSPYKAIPIPRRRELLGYLVEDLVKTYSFTKESFRMGSVVETIVKACFPPEEICQDAKKRKNGLATVRKELTTAVFDYFNEGVKKLEEYNPSKHGRLAEEMDRSIPKVELPTTGVDKEASEILGFDDE
ncbi:MAG: hypothetical protein OIN85_00665 [Candidatus Methanoperedens sp.]|nr:hypothetical protein [Candidatus Methanoperedens sp.]